MLKGYKTKPILGSNGTSLPLLYKGLGYINGNRYHVLPIAHNILHGICKDLLKLLFEP